MPEEAPPEKPLESQPVNNIERDTDSASEQLNNLQPSPPAPARDFFEFLFDLFKTGVVVLVLALIIRYFAIQPFIVDGNSMVPNYHDKEYLLAEKVSYLVSQPKRGDVVVFRFPKDPSVNYIKRIIGLPGETVKIKDDQITIINSAHPEGLILNETYIPKDSLTEVGNADGYEKKLNDNEYFVLGDNRQHSSDSREWEVLPKANLLGRAWVSIAKLGNENSNLPQFYFKIHDRTTFPD